MPADRVPTAARALAKRDKLSAAAFALGPSPPRRLLTDTLARLLPNASYPAIFQSCGWVDGPGAATDTRVSALCWALAGNPDPLSRGEAVYPGVLPRQPTRVPVLIEDARPRASFRGSGPGYRAAVAVRVEAGPYCPDLVRVSWNETHARRLAEHPVFGLGFSRERKQPYAHPGQLQGLRCYALLGVENGLPRLMKVYATASQRARNLEVINPRFRVGFSCPKAFKHPCHLCPVGRDECPASPHPRGWAAGQCPVCHARAWIDPDWGGGSCVNCAKKL